MANYYGTTASTGAKIKKNKIVDLEKYLENWTCPGEEGDLLHVEGDWFHISGYDRTPGRFRAMTTAWPALSQ